jgi:predicted DCC family thiol-disulfide oxidoreductase YuxK
MWRWILIYDGDCEFCQSQIRLVERLDQQRRIEAIPFQSADLEACGVGRQAAEEAMHLVTPSGKVTRGAEAARDVLRLLPRVRLLAWAFQLPGALPVAEGAYRWVARRRHRFGCTSAACRRGVAPS